VYGSGAVVWSWSLLIRGHSVPVVRRKLHLSSCADFRDRLSFRKAREPFGTLFSWWASNGLCARDEEISYARRSFGARSGMSGLYIRQLRSAETDKACDISPPEAATTGLVMEALPNTWWGDATFPSQDIRGGNRHVVRTKKVALRQVGRIQGDGENVWACRPWRAIICCGERADRVR
jgi:hypothetical protein